MEAVDQEMRLRQHSYELVGRQTAALAAVNPTDIDNEVEAVDEEMNGV